MRLVNFLSDKQKGKPAADTTALEAEIDRLVYQFYYHKPEEMAIVENSAK